MNRLEPIVSGDITSLDFIAQTADGPVVSLAAYTDIVVQVFALAGDKPTGAALINANLVGAVDLVGGGTGGLFTLPITIANTVALAGDYWLEVRFADAAGLLRTGLQAILPITEDLVTT